MRRRASSSLCAVPEIPSEGNLACSDSIRGEFNLDPRRVRRVDARRYIDGKSRRSKQPDEESDAVGR